MEDHGRQEEADAFGSAVDGSGQAASLPGQMEALVQSEQVFIDLAGHGPDGFLGDTGEDGIAGFLEYSGTDAGCTVYSL